MNERPNTFREYEEHKNAEKKDPLGISFSYTDSSYNFLLDRYKKVQAEAKRVVGELYENREYNLETNYRLEEQKSELEQLQDKLQVAKAIQKLSKTAGFPEDESLVEFISETTELIKQYSEKVERLGNAIERNNENDEGAYRNPIIMGQIEEDAIQENLDREQK